jgi:hypothetical protein
VKAVVSQGKILDWFNQESSRLADGSTVKRGKVMETMTVNKRKQGTFCEASRQSETFAFPLEQPR